MLRNMILRDESFIDGNGLRIAYAAVSDHCTALLLAVALQVYAWGDVHQIKEVPKGRPCQQNITFSVLEVP